MNRNLVRRHAEMYSKPTLSAHLSSLIVRRRLGQNSLALSLFYIILCCILCSCCDEKQIPGLIEKLDSSITRERNQAALDLASCGSKASKAVTRLAELLYDDSVGVQSSAAYALRKIDTPEARAIMTRVESSRKK